MIMKSYTDLEQSKILSRILPIESADNYYSWHDEQYYVVNKDCPYPYSLKEKIPCWSLNALLCNIPSPVLSENSGSWTVSSLDSKFPISSFGNGKNPVDACYEMIILLNKHNYYD